MIPAGPCKTRPRLPTPDVCRRTSPLRREMDNRNHTAVVRPDNPARGTSRGWTLWLSTPRLAVLFDQCPSRVLHLRSTQVEPWKGQVSG